MRKAMGLLAVLLLCLCAMPATAAPEVEPVDWIDGVAQMVSEWVEGVWEAVWQPSGTDGTPSESQDSGPLIDPYGPPGPAGSSSNGVADNFGPVIEPNGKPEAGTTKWGPVPDPYGPPELEPSKFM